MNYIYDVVLNYNENLYEFYDWNLNDDIIHIRRIPLIKIKRKSLLEIIKTKIKINNNFKNQIKNKTEIFSKNKNNYLNYSCLFCDGINVIGVVFNQEGLSIQKTKMLLDEEIEVLDICEGLIEKEIEYQVIKEEKINNFKTRLELEKQLYIENEIKKIINIEKLKYLYYECFNKIETNQEIIISHINHSLKKDWDKISPILYNFFKLTSIKK